MNQQAMDAAGEEHERATRPDEPRDPSTERTEQEPNEEPLTGNEQPRDPDADPMPEGDPARDPDPDREDLGDAMGEVLANPRTPARAERSHDERNEHV